MNKVRVGSLYSYQPVMIDACDQKLNHIDYGQIVKVKNMHNCPKANTMGMCYIFTMDGEKFLGMVSVNSLKHVVKKGKKYYIKD